MYKGQRATRIATVGGYGSRLDDADQDAESAREVSEAHAVVL